MGSRKIFRGNIFLVDLNGQYDGTTKAKHPVIIVNSVRSILKADIVTVVPCTSNIGRVLQSHVLIEGYGLDKPSKVLTEQILTISKEDLGTYIGHIDGVKMLEIDSALRNHLQLQDTRNLTTSQIANLFLEENMDEDIRELEILKSKFYTNYLEKDYEKAKKLNCELNKKSRQYKQYDYTWYSLYSLSVINIKEKEYVQALTNSEESLKFLANLDIYNNSYALSMWSIASSLEYLELKDRAIKIYQKLNKIYQLKGDYKQRISILWNINKINKNQNRLIGLIKIVKKCEDVIWYTSLTKEDYLRIMKTELMQLDA